MAPLNVALSKLPIAQNLAGLVFEELNSGQFRTIFA